MILPKRHWKSWILSSCLTTIHTRKFAVHSLGIVYLLPDWNLERYSLVHRCQNCYVMCLRSFHMRFVFSTIPFGCGMDRKESPIKNLQKSMIVCHLGHQLKSQLALNLRLLPLQLSALSTASKFPIAYINSLGRYRTQLIQVSIITLHAPLYNPKPFSN